MAQRRNPSVLLLLAPAAVQGREASASIAEAIRLLNQDGRSEVILVGRGGGSAEDLWAFNEEETVRAVASSGIPVISAVGHETDVSLCDYAADLRAATPTAAAELAIPDRTVLLQALERRSELLRERMNRLLAEKQRKLSSLQQMPALHDPAFFLNKNRQRLDYLIESMYDLSRREIPRRSEQLGHRAALLESLSPLGILSRGYAIAERGGRPILSADELSHGEELCLRRTAGWPRSAWSASICLMGRKNMTFEQALHRLDEIAERLGDGGTTLEESLALYAEGAGLIERCSREAWGSKAQARNTGISEGWRDRWTLISGSGKTGRWSSCGSRPTAHRNPPT